LVGDQAGMTVRVLSLGAGVQSTAMALMAAHGELGPMPDVALFADTGAEPLPTYDYLRWLMSDNVLPFPVKIVSAGNIRDDMLAGLNSTGQQFASIPFFTLYQGKAGMGRRQCTKEYKLAPLQRAARELLGGKRTRGGIEMWIGISTDEAIRMKPSRVGYITNRWPLIEKRLSRTDCLAWIERNGYPRPPKSACTFCPYRSDEGWRTMKETDPVSFEDAVAVDKALREGSHQRRLKAELYLHRSLKPLEEVDLRSAAELGQSDLFGNECEGMCGV
jgi:hypothetical protein